MSEHLTCKKCGYKQYDDDTIASYKSKYPNVEAHDIPYICGACMDNDENSELKEFVVPVYWTMSARLRIRAESIEEAIEIAKDKNNELPLPKGEYLDGSWEVPDDLSPEEIMDLYN